MLSCISKAGRGSIYPTSLLSVFIIDCVSLHFPIFTNKYLLNNVRIFYLFIHANTCIYFICIIPLHVYLCFKGLPHNSRDGVIIIRTPNYLFSFLSFIWYLMLQYLVIYVLNTQWKWRLKYEMNKYNTCKRRFLCCLVFYLFYMYHTIACILMFQRTPT
jgi:hypothetical protein